MGGKTRAQSTEGEGSEFSFVIPLATEASGHPAEQKPPSRSNRDEGEIALRILLAEDVPFNAKLIEKLLQHKGWEVVGLKHLCRPSAKGVVFVDVPAMKYLMIDGTGNGHHCSRVAVSGSDNNYFMECRPNKLPSVSLTREIWPYSPIDIFPC